MKVLIQMKGHWVVHTRALLVIAGAVGCIVGIGAAKKSTASANVVHFEVKKGDGAKTLSKKLYGSRCYWNEIIAHNPKFFKKNILLPRNVRIKFNPYQLVSKESLKCQGPMPHSKDSAISFAYLDASGLKPNKPAVMRKKSALASSPALIQRKPASKTQASLPKEVKADSTKDVRVIVPSKPVTAPVAESGNSADAPALVEVNLSKQSPVKYPVRQKETYAAVETEKISASEVKKVRPIAPSTAKASDIGPVSLTSFYELAIPDSKKIAEVALSKSPPKVRADFVPSEPIPVKRVPASQPSLGQKALEVQAL
ncbi:MAG: hypothetical protein JNL01_09785 [Bdellovibrionales bacterium]|nr:hypothetical protein [Bdellovibrionales bacterium]